MANWLIHRTALLAITVIIGCAETDRDAAPAPPIPDDVQVAVAALSYQIRSDEELEPNGQPKIVFVGRVSPLQNFQIVDVSSEVFAGLHSNEFSIRLVSHSELKPIANEPLYVIKDKVTGERGTRLLLSDVDYLDGKAVVNLFRCMSSFDGIGIKFKLSLMRDDGSWKVVNSERGGTP